MKPILFNTEMVKAILEGRKTVTRRVMKPQPDGRPVPMTKDSCYPGYFAIQGTEKVVRPPFQPGDILWVRETFRVDYLSNIPGSGRVQYKDDAYMDISFDAKRYNMMRRAQRKPGWRPNENMPREAARIFLRVTCVRVERLQDMVLGDVLMEGITEAGTYEKTWGRWHQTWDSTIKPADLPTYGWETNPWVWVIEFERISKEEADEA
ncbi:MULTISPECIES: hypothetical protein [environmental samples]|uniref:hypothetical protein n=1 Tax=environmental samples TaxID=876090 RepID=UPI00033954DF|nr:MULTISPECIES: hypothetical protein [environmental samples]CDC70016.1 putative uncharacterized protein [Oscillibacter sp. CAG:155]